MDWAAQPYARADHQRTSSVTPIPCARCIYLSATISVATGAPHCRRPGPPLVRQLITPFLFVVGQGYIAHWHTRRRSLRSCLRRPDVEVQLILDQTFHRVCKLFRLKLSCLHVPPSACLCLVNDCGGRASTNVTSGDVSCAYPEILSGACGVLACQDCQNKQAETMW